MRRAVLLLLVLGLVAGGTPPLAASYEEIRSAYLTGWFDAFRIAYYMKRAKKVKIPSGWWVVYPLHNLPVEYIAFYVFAGMREGVKPMLTQDEIVFGVFERKADAEFLAQKLQLKDVEASVRWGEATDGLLGVDLKSVFVEPKNGVDAVLYHIDRAIRKAQDIDPSVLNRDLLLQDLKLIKRELERWKSGRKGYIPVIASSPVVRKKEKEKREKEEKVRSFLEQTNREEKRKIIEKFLREAR